MADRSWPNYWPPDADSWARCGRCEGRGVFIAGTEGDWDEYNCECHYGRLYADANGQPILVYGGSLEAAMKLWNQRDTSLQGQPPTVELCPECRGSRRDVLHTGQSCPDCNGAGVVPIDESDEGA